jgi:hypothetical protein
MPALHDVDIQLSVASGPFQVRALLEYADDVLENTF